MSIAILRGDARSLPLPDECVDLICTSPPYFSLRDYRDGGQSLDGQIGAEASPHEYVDALVECTAEWMRVLKPSGSIFVVLGDKYANDAKWGGATSGKHVASLHGQTSIGRAKMRSGMPAKSLMGLPWRYAIRCVDELGLILRAEVLWSKVNGLPESVTDRVRRSHEQILHFTKESRYYSALDEIREGYAPGTAKRYAAGYNERSIDGKRLGIGVKLGGDTYDENPLGKLPGSVWEISSQPLNVPDRISHARCCNGRKRPGCTDGLDHHAAYPFDLIRPVILGWSPAAICIGCGEGRRPVSASTTVFDKARDQAHASDIASRVASRDVMSGGTARSTLNGRTTKAITGYACACTPYTDRPERRKPTVTPTREPRTDNDVRAEAMGRRHHGNDWPERLPVREYHFDRWIPAPTRPALVLDPFSGTGSTLLVADALGRSAVGVDRSHDYCGIARWRTADPGERARAMQVPRPPVIPDGQDALFSLEAS